MSILYEAPGIVSFPATGQTGACTVGGTGTVAKIFPAGAGAPSSESAAILRVPGGAGASPLPPILEGKKFVVRASGVVTVAGTSPTLQFGLYASSTLLSTTNQLIAAQWTTLGTAFPNSAQSVTTSASYPWYIEAELSGDTISGALQGALKSCVANVLNASTALSANSGTTLSSLSFNNNPVFYIACGVTFGVSNSANLAQLDQFILVDSQ